MRELFRLIETHETAAKLSIASGATVFESGIRRLPSVAALLRRGVIEGEVRKRIGTRVWELARQKIDVRYRHPHDISIAIYLWVLDAIDQYLPRDQRLAPLAAAVVLEMGRNCSWADRVAHSIGSAADFDHQTTCTIIGDSGVVGTYSDVDEIRIHMLDVGVLADTTSGTWAFHILQPNKVTEIATHADPSPLAADSDTSNIQIALAA